MEQAVATKLPTTSKFHATASEPQLIPTRLDFLSASYGRSSSSSGSIDGGRSWDERILDLSAELQQICGSPLSPNCFIGGVPVPESMEPPAHWVVTSTTSSAVGAPPPMPPAATSPRAVPPTASSGTDRRSGQWSTPPSRLTGSLGRCADRSSGSDLVRRTISLQGGGQSSSGVIRPIMVRHEETPETLAKRLSVICGQTSQPIVAAAAAAAAVGDASETSSTSSTEESRPASKSRADVTSGSKGWLVGIWI